MKIATLFVALFLVAPACAQQAAPELISGCVPCHGANGIARYGEVPILAGQNAPYLLNQLHAFQTGKRTHKEMRYMNSQSDGRGDGGHRGLFLKPAAEVIGGGYGAGLGSGQAPATGLTPRPSLRIICRRCRKSSATLREPRRPASSAYTPVGLARRQFPHSYGESGFRSLAISHSCTDRPGNCTRMPKARGARPR